MKASFVYGPVPSRRLGRSLGVDLVPFKTCSYDCIYCQLGRTTSKTADRSEYVPVDRVLDELEARLRDGPRPDYIGLAGSGEPTLHARLGDIIARVKRLTDIPVAVLTNGSLLWKPEVREGLRQADLVLPSLDAGTGQTFERVNRPHPAISFERMVEGLVDFSREFRGEIWLEVFVLGGITDRREEARRIAEIVETVRPHRVQLNTVSRPPAEPCALAAVTGWMEALCGLFPAPCEVIADVPSIERPASGGRRDAEDEIAALLGRRPCTVQGIATGLGLSPNDVLKHLATLRARGIVRSERRGDSVFHEVTRGPPRA